MYKWVGNITRVHEPNSIPTHGAAGSKSSSKDKALGGTICLYSGNITAYGVKAKAFFGHRLIDESQGEKAIVACLQEVHKKEEECREEAEKLEAKGWRTTWNPGKPRDRGGCNSPGSMMASSGVHIDYTAKGVKEFVGDAVGALRWQCKDCTFGVLHLKSFKILVVNVYLTSAVKFTGDNVEKLMHLKELVRLLGLPFIMVGDWNMTPSELAETGWVKESGGQYLHP